MKKRSFVIIVLLTAVLGGCASVLPKAMSTDVYFSERDAIVAENNLQTATATTGIQNENINQRLATAWGDVALAEIREKAQSDGPSASASNPKATIDENGVLGGFNCLFTNESPDREKTISATKVGGFMNGQKFIIPLNKGDRRVFKLPAGHFIYTWTVENDSNVYPEKGPRSFNVAAVPKSFDAKSNINYHGGVRLFGY